MQFVYLAGGTWKAFTAHCTLKFFPLPGRTRVHAFNEGLDMKVMHDTSWGRRRRRGSTDRSITAF